MSKGSQKSSFVGLVGLNQTASLNWRRPHNLRVARKVELKQHNLYLEDTKTPISLAWLVSNSLPL